MGASSIFNFSQAAKSGKREKERERHDVWPQSPLDTPPHNSSVTRTRDFFVVFQCDTPKKKPKSNEKNMTFFTSHFWLFFIYNVQCLTLNTTAKQTYKIYSRCRYRCSFLPNLAYSSVEGESFESFRSGNDLR